MTMETTPPDPAPPLFASEVPAIIDLTDGTSGRVTVKVPQRTDPFASMTPAQRRRLLVRVLCELVAYGEDDTPTRAATYAPPMAEPAPPAPSVMTPF
jgi:hypothetical protein